MATALSKLRKHLGSSGKTRPASFLPRELCRHFSLDEMKKATHDFNEELIIGKGGSSTVYKGFIDKGNSRPVAIKCLNLPRSEVFRTESLLLCQIRHVNIVPFIGYYADEGKMILVYDFMANKTLGDHLCDSNKPPLLWKQRLQICIGAARGLHFLHTGLKHTVIHRDVKSSNILLDEKWVAKVSDFGGSKLVVNNMRFQKSGNHIVEMEGTQGPLDFVLSEQISITSMASYNDSSGMTTFVRGTMGYLDPAYFHSRRVTTKSDVYSFGVVLMEVLCARKAIFWEIVEGRRLLATWAVQCYKNGSIGEIIDPYLKGKIAPECFKVYVEIAFSCLQEQGIQRPTMVDVVEKLELALELQEKADSEREKMISPDSW